MRRYLIPVAALIAVAVMSMPAQAQRPTVGVTTFQTAAKNIDCGPISAHAGHDCNRELGEGFRIMLETAIVKSGKMSVMERSSLNTVMSEQLLAEAELTTSGGTVGGLTGVDYLIYGAITKFGAREEGFSMPGGQGVASLLDDRIAGVLAGISSENATTEMSVDLKVTDVATGAIILADTVSGEVQQGRMISAGGITVGDASGDPYADVQRVLAAKIAEAVVTTRIPFKVIKVQADGTLIVNYGNAFLNPGDQLGIFDVGEQFVDPDTGEVLGSEETQVGLVQVTAAEPKFSRAAVISSSAPVREGSVLRRAYVAENQRKVERQRTGARF